MKRLLAALFAMVAVIPPSARAGTPQQAYDYGFQLAAQVYCLMNFGYSVRVADQIDDAGYHELRAAGADDARKQFFALDGDAAIKRWCDFRAYMRNPIWD